MPFGDGESGNTDANENIPKGLGAPAENSQVLIVKADGSIEVPWIIPRASELILEIHRALNAKPFPVRVLSGNIYCG